MRKNKIILKKIVGLLIITILGGNVFAQADKSIPEVSIQESVEIPDFTQSPFRIRQNQKSGKPYLSIVREENPQPRYRFQKDQTPLARPDYRMLSETKKEMKSIPYDGPVSDRTKVYVFAGAMIASGIATGATAALAPAATGAGTAAGSGAGLFGLASLGIAGGTTMRALQQGKPDPERAFIHESKARILEIRKPENQAP